MSMAAQTLVFVALHNILSGSNYCILLSLHISMQAGQKAVKVLLSQFAQQCFVGLSQQSLSKPSRPAAQLSSTAVTAAACNQG